jgi:hypothetical protein
MRHQSNNPIEIAKLKANNQLFIYAETVVGHASVGAKHFRRISSFNLCVEPQDFEG